MRIPLYPLYQRQFSLVDFFLPGGVAFELLNDKGVTMRNVSARNVLIGVLVAGLISIAGASQATVRRSWYNDDCGPHLVLRVGSQGWSYAESWENGTLAYDMVDWGYLDYPYYKRSYEVPWWSTQQIYTEASLRWLDLPYLVCY